jgi:hypothetical protein
MVSSARCCRDVCGHRRHRAASARSQQQSHCGGQRVTRDDRDEEVSSRRSFRRHTTGGNATRLGVPRSIRTALGENRRNAAAHRKGEFSRKLLGGDGAACQNRPLTVIARRRAGDVIWEHFEYLTVLAQDWAAAHPKGTYPAGTRRIELKDERVEADEQYASALAPV